jgi:hypothetical protein
VFLLNVGLESRLRGKSTLGLYGAFSVIPAQAGILRFQTLAWVSAFAGTTILDKRYGFHAASVNSGLCVGWGLCRMVP